MIEAVRTGKPAAAVADPPPRRSGGARPQVLVVEDERAVRETLAYNLRRAGMDVCAVEDGEAGLAAAQRLQPDLILLDVLLPGGLDGFEVCRQLRHVLRCPIVIISARTDEIDRVVGLEVGADDYVTKPFSIVELLARIKAHLRRAEMLDARLDREATAGPAAPHGGAAPERPLVLGGLEIDPARREVRVDGKSVRLKRREFDLLHYLARHAGTTVSRANLLDAIWPDEFPGRGDTRTVDVHVHRLRDKIERDPARPRYLHTVRGLGYTVQAVNLPLMPA